MFYASLYDIKWSLLQSYHKFSMKSPNLYDLQLNTIRLKGLPLKYDPLDLKVKIQQILSQT